MKFCTGVPIRFLCLRTLRAGTATNREIMKQVRKLI